MKLEIDKFEFEKIKKNREIGFGKNRKKEKLLF